MRTETPNPEVLSEMNTCHICEKQTVAILLDFGLQPICNRFLTHPKAEEVAFPLVIGQCQACGLVQISMPVSAAELKPRLGWITYNEPERHLDHLADVICTLPGITNEAKMCGISFKDDTLLQRMKDRGVQSVWRLRIDTEEVGIETVQDKLDIETARTVAHSRGRADVVIARHIFEHTHNPGRFLKALAELVAWNGYIVLEIPDCERSLEKCDYSTIWEEHVLYFTPESFRQTLSFAGLALVHFEVVPYALENSLVAIARFEPQSAISHPADEALETEKRRALVFARDLRAQREWYQAFVEEHRRQKGKIAMFGAGHLTCMFINLLQLRENIEFVVDDNPHKRGLFMPGSRLPVLGSNVLVEQDIELCLLGLSPDSEEEVIRNNQIFLEHGGRFASILPASKRALLE